MSIATIAAAHVVISNSNRRYGGGGGGGGDFDDDLKWFVWFMGIIVSGLVCFLAYIIFVGSHDETQKPYLVNGTLHSYETKKYSKSKRVFVNLLQEDGVIRQYRTSHRPGECYYHPPGVSVPVEVTATYNTWTKDTRYDSQLVVDACLK